MKQITENWLALCLLLLATGTYGQGDSIHVLFQSSAGAFTGAAAGMSWWQGVQFTGSTVDLNDNGTMDLPVIFSTDPLELRVVDGGNGQVIWNMNEEDLGVVSPDSFIVFRMREVTGTGITAILEYVESAEFRYHLIDMDTRQAEPGEWCGLGRLLWSEGDWNGDGFAELITGHNGIITVLSLLNDSIAANEIAPPQVTSPSNQEVVLKFESAPSSRLPIPRGQFFTQRSIDINQDGILDLVIVREDPQDGSLGLSVRNMQNGDVMWVWDIPENDKDITGPFHGFHDVNADGTPEAYFGERVFVNQQNEVSKLPEGFVIIGFADIDDDGFEDLWGYRKQDSVVQIWGASGTSAVHDKEHESHLQLAIQPNLVSGSTQIHYWLDERAQVAATVHDLSGKVLLGLFQGQQGKGRHMITWVTSDSGLPPGMYVISLSANGHRMSGRIVLLE